MKRSLALGIVLVIGVAVAGVLGPRPDTDDTVRFSGAFIEPDLPAWLAEREAQLPGLKPDAVKEIVWAGRYGEKTALAIVYLHGFSASKTELRPVPDTLAQQLGANLFYTRLTGHGADGAALAETTMNDWINDVAEAIAVGERLGERILIIGTSTGGTLAAWAAAQPDLTGAVAGIVMVSPNFAIHGASTRLMNLPWVERLLPLIIGQTRSFTPHNEAHAAGWTYSYPTRAIFPMAALLRRAEGLPFEAITLPVLAVFSPHDRVVVSAATRAVLQRWGGPVSTLELDRSDDPYDHVIAGDVLSPSTTAEVVEAIAAWVGERIVPVTAPSGP